MSAIKEIFHDQIVSMLSDDRGERFYLTAEEERDFLLTLPDKDYTPEQKAFLDEIYFDAETDISFMEMNAEMDMADFEQKHGRKPNYKEMSQGW